MKDRHIGTERVRQRKECCLLIALIHKRPPQQPVSRTLPRVQRHTHPISPHPKPSDLKPPPLYQHKKMQHGTFLFTLACNSPPPPPPLHHPTHTHTHPWPPPFPPLYQLKGIWLLPSDSPRLKVPFTLPQFTKRSDYGKQKYCVRAPFFCAWAKRCERHKNSGGKEREIEREPLIKLHLVKQTSLHSSCQKRRIYVAVNKKQYLRVLTETNVGRGQPYIIHSAPRPRPTFSSQVGFPYVVETAAFLEACCFLGHGGAIFSKGLCF